MTLLLYLLLCFSLAWPQSCLPALGLALATPSPTPTPSPKPTPSPAPTPSPTPTRNGSWRIQGEYRVSWPATSAATRSREPIVASDPLLAGHLAAVFNVGGEPGRVTIRISHDGGRTWRTATGRPEGGGNHPTLAWGPGPVRGSARLYYSGMGGSNDLYHHMISWSDDEGRTWSTPYVADSTRGWFGGYPDMVVDNDRRSPNYGVLYFVYNWPKDPVRGPGMRVLASGDYGRTFAQVEIPKLRPPAGYGDAWRIGYRLATAPDGSAYVSGYQADMRVWRSDEPFATGGRANVGRMAYGVARLRYQRRTGRLTNGPNVLVIRQPETAWNLGSAPAGLSVPMMQPLWDTGLTVDRGGRIYFAVALDGRIHLRKSDDHGRTWTRVVLPRMPRIHGRSQLEVRPDLVAGRGFVAVLFHSIDAEARRRTEGAAAAVSFDRGASWDGPRAIGRARWATTPIAPLILAAGLRDRATLLAGGHTFYFAYGDGRDGLSSIFGARLVVHLGRVRAAR